ncbi:MAG: LysM peptidoglycan-binding domain-containing protein [Verrucomicrobiota bacterium]|jgi:LysM repeat protein
MSFFGRWNIVWLAALLWAAGYGCSPMDSGAMDEEKEPHYVLGKSRVNAMDYPGAINAFEESLEANPHSAQAHYQLAMLYENQESDPAAAIYHYQQFLKYDPRSDNAEIIAQHIAICKQQLATDVLQLPSAPAAQQQLEKLTEENRRLHDQLNQWTTWYATQLAAKTNVPAAQYNYALQPANTAQPLATSVTPDDVTLQNGAAASTGAAAGAGYGAVSPPRRTGTSKALPPVRTHVVLKGETLASIARKHGVPLNALEEANPYVNPKKLKAGQVLNLPAQ